MKKLVWGLALMAVGFVGGALAEKKAKEIEQPKLDSLAWKAAAPDLPVMAADAWKGPGGSYCQFNKFPKGFAVPTHWHSKDVYSIVIAGQWGSHSEGTPESLQGPGGYQIIPGGVKHETKCGDAGECVVFTCGPAAFDLKGLPPPPKK
jgi:hypothetical protein